MENYIYETANGFIGYFQIEENKCRHLPYNYEAQYIEGGSWGSNFRLLKAVSSDPENYVVTEEMIHDSISYHINKNQHVENEKVTKTIKVNDAGSYFPRINRNEPGLTEHQINSKERADEIRSFDNILSSLIETFRTIEPEPANLNTYGNRIREQLIVACTEVEYLLKRTVVENGREPKRKNYTTADYFWCFSVQKLNDYEVRLPSYPSLGSFNPFKNWSSPEYTKSLDWYDAYNKVKHDRGNTKHLATLGALINSIAAIHILLEAQYGAELFDYRFQHTFRTIFLSSSRPTWKAEEICTPILQREFTAWQNIKHYP